MNCELVQLFKRINKMIHLQASTYINLVSLCLYIRTHTKMGLSLLHTKLNWFLLFTCDKIVQTFKFFIKKLFHDIYIQYKQTFTLNINKLAG